MKQRVPVSIPDNLWEFVEKKARVKIAFGGRGGGKTESVARMLTMRGAKSKQRTFCLRQHMNSIEESVHSVLAKSIEALQASSIYNVLRSEINAVNGSKFFYGQLDRNLTSIKSKDEVDVAWVEEAEDITQEALDILIPTIRAENSELWFTLNIKGEDGVIYDKYIKPHFDYLEKNKVYYSPEDGGLLIVWVNLEDNPLAPDELRLESDKMKREDPVKWKHIWGGYPQIESDDDNLIRADLVIPAAHANDVPENGPLIIGVDPARFGKDETAIIRRKGRVAFGLSTLSNQDTMALAGRIALIIKLEDPDMVFIDMGSFGAAIVDRLHELGYDDVVKGVNFGGKATQPERFYNKRAEMWDKTRAWLEDGPVSIPNKPRLIRDLVTPKYKISSNGKLQLESKEDMKKRLGRSVDAGDALALTFAFDVRSRETKSRIQMEMEKASFNIGDTVAGY